MTGRERILAVLAGQKANHLPSMPITMMFAADILGVPYGQYARNHKLLADAQIKTAEQFGFDYVSAISDPAREAADAGAKIQWFENQPPAILEDEALFADKSALGRVVEGWVEGPCAEAADLRGINRLMTDFSDDPAFVRDLFAFTVETAIRFAHAQIQAGADIIGIGDAAASLVGPRIYKEFVWPEEKRLVHAIHALGGRVRLHICGNTRRLLEGMGQLGCEMVDIDYPVPMSEARAGMGPLQTLAGNLNPVKDLRDGTPESIAQALEALQQQAGPQWIVAVGCEIVRDTPHRNVHALVNFAQTHTAAITGS